MYKRCRILEIGMACAFLSVAPIALGAAVSPATLTPEHFAKTATVKDDAMEVVAVIDTSEGFKEKHGLLDIVWDDNFLRAFIDKRSGMVTYQVYQRSYYDAHEWRFYSTVNYQGPAGIETKALTVISRETEGCTGSGECAYVEDVGFEVREDMLRELKKLYLANYSPPWAWKFRLKGRAGPDLDGGILPAEIAGLLDRVDQYFADHPTIHRASTSPADAGAAPAAAASDRPRLGVSAGNKSELPPVVVAALQSATLRGVFVGVVQPGSVGEAAGIKVGDDIFEYAGKAIASGKELVAAVQATEFGADVPIRLIRAGAEVGLTAHFGKK